MTDATESPDIGSSGAPAKPKPPATPAKPSRPAEEAAGPDPKQTHPFVAVYVQGTGIHPSTSRLVTLDAVTFDDTGVVGEEFHALFNVPDPGPRHMHGVPPGLFDRAAKFSRHLKALDKLIDGRTLITHDAPLTWGYIYSEARRAMNAAARANRSRNRRGGRRRQRVGHVPEPVAIVDTLATARRQGAVPTDARLEAIAAAAGVAAPGASASVERAQRSEEETSRERTLILVSLYLKQASDGELATRTPDELTGDRFGLQRARIRVDAEKAAPERGNPGLYTPKSGLRPGMEIVVSDDITANHDDLIATALDLGLTYSEKLTRETSLVVTNAPRDPDSLRGKAMHAERKNIPLLTDEEFVAAARDAAR